MEPSAPRRTRPMLVRLLIAVVVLLAVLWIGVQLFEQTTGLDVPEPFEPEPTRYVVTPFADLPTPLPIATATP